MAGRFSEIPFFLLNDYFSTITQFYGSPKSWYSSLLGPGNLIVARGGFWTPMYVKTDNTYQKVLVHPIANYTNGRFFYFFKNTAIEEFLPGDEIYLRKDSFIHDWLNTYRANIYDDFLNLQKEFLYFGKIYPSDRGGRYFQIEYNGLRNWIVEALPENDHIRTPKLKKYFDVAFDQVYNEVYHKTRDIFSLLSPFEAKYEYLPDLPSYYSYPLDSFLLDREDDGYVEERRKRELIKDLGPFLKRKGTYTSLYIIWRILTSGSQNPFEIRERWHSPAVSGNPSEHFLDWNYLSFYTGDANDLITTDPPPSAAPDYPTPEDDLLLSPHYRIIFDLSERPINTNSILDSNTAKGLIENWERMRPVNRYPHYCGVISPELSLLGGERTLYDEEEFEDNNVFSRSYILTQSLEGTYIHVQTEDSRIWYFTHDLDTENVLVKVFDSEGIQGVPANITIAGTNAITLEFSKPKSGFAFVVEADYSLTQPTIPLLDWTLEHALGNRFVHSYFMDQNNEKHQPLRVQSESEDVLSAEFNAPVIGRGMVKSGEKQITVSTASDTWLIEHGLENIGVIVDTYDQNWEKIFPKSIKLMNENQTEIKFHEPVTGYAVFSRVGQVVIESIVMDKLRNGYFQVGEGDRQVSPIISEIPDPVYQDTIKEYWEDDSNYYFKLFINNIEDIDLREVGLFGDDDILYFYTYAETIYIPKESSFIVIYKIQKGNTGD